MPRSGLHPDRHRLSDPATDPTPNAARSRYGGVFGVVPSGGPPIDPIVVTFSCAVSGVSKGNVDQAGGVKFRPTVGLLDRA